MSTCAETVNEPYAYFKDKPLTVILYSEHPNHYSSLISSLPTFQGQVEYLVTSDVAKLVSHNPQTVSPILLLVTEPEHLDCCIKLYKQLRLTEQADVMITTPKIAQSEPVKLQGILVCAQHEDLAESVKSLADVLLKPCMCDGMIGIDYVDVFPLFGSSNGGRLLLSTASHPSDPKVAINECLNDLKHRLHTDSECHYVIGYLGFNYAAHGVSLDDYESLISGLTHLVSDVPIVIGAPNGIEAEIYCGLMVVIS